MTYRPSTHVSYLTLYLISHLSHTLSSLTIYLSFFSFFHALSFLKHLQILYPVHRRLFSFIFFNAHLKNSQFKSHIPGNPFQTSRLTTLLNNYDLDQELCFITKYLGGLLILSIILDELFPHRGSVAFYKDSTFLWGLYY